MLNADSPKNMLRNIEDAVKALFAAGYTEIHFETENAMIPRAVANLGFNVAPSNEQGGYVVTRGEA